MSMENCVITKGKKVKGQKNKGYEKDCFNGDDDRFRI